MTCREPSSNGGSATHTDTTPATANEFNNNQWHHFVAVFENNTSRILYVNGVSRSTNTTDVDFIAATDSFVIGANNDNNSISKEFEGKISEVALYSSALSASQVKTIYNGREPYNHKEGIASGSLEAWWRMGDGTENASGTTIYDMSVNSNNGTFSDDNASGIQYTGDTP